METPHLSVTTANRVLTITMDRPERLNAINGQMREELNAAWLRFRDDESAWVTA